MKKLYGKQKQAPIVQLDNRSKFSRFRSQVYNTRYVENVNESIVFSQSFLQKATKFERDIYVYIFVYNYAHSNYLN